MNNEQNLLKEIDDLKIEIKKLKAHKKYGLVWGEKPEKFEKDSVNALPILLEKGGKFKDIVNNKKDDFNILIEGDNYHSLSVLNYTHKGKIDVIYIDPPYNTGNKDFIYNDYFVDKEDRYRHSKWLSFMEKRLKLAKTLLSKSGLFFISIDDNEQAQLKILCDEIFGKENFIAQLIWENKEGGGKSDSNFFRIKHEYVLVYARNITKAKIKGLNVEDEDRYKLSDEFENERGKYQLIKLDSASLGYVKSLDYPITAPDGSLVYPNLGDKKISRWRWGREKLEWGFKNSFVVVKKDKKSNWIVYTKQYFNCDNEGNILERKLQPIGVIPSYSTTQSNRTIKDIFGEAVFNYSKPADLIKYILNISLDNNSYVLDFFAGSGTTGQAVVELNNEDGGNRRFILCTNNGDEKSEHKICEDICFKRLDIVMSKGYKDKKPLGGNLKYLKTDFIKYKDTNMDTLKRKIVEASTEVLCLKENTFDLVKDLYKDEKIKIYQNNKKYMAILFDLFYLDEFIERLKELKDKHISIYVFSYTKEFDRDEIGDLNTSYNIEPIPENILETYKKIFNF